jgi:Na+-translocating ferredoxin:NAD+ oxidoreductase RNF subunit RnfB
MNELKHGFRIDAEKCEGRMACMRTCPTQAIRVKKGKATVISELCIDCGSCLGVCPSGAISATTISFAELDRFKFKVAVASPALYTQFSLMERPGRVNQALLGLGFDAVWEYAVDLELVNLAIRDDVRKWPGPFPLISNSCPVVVRLVQVAYPSLVDQLIRIESPREIAGREVKRRYSQKLGLKPEDIAAIYITPCQAKTISILEPAEGAGSYLDGAVGISQIYNDLLAILRRNPEKDECAANATGSSEWFHWGAPEGEFPNLSKEHYLPLQGLSDIIKVFGDIEKGKIRNIDFLECHACQGGCIGGNLTVENLYVARSRNLQLISSLPRPSRQFIREVGRRRASEDFSLRAPLRPRDIEGKEVDLRERVARKNRTAELLRSLAVLNCGLCGAPTCRSHAGDVAHARAKIADCVFLSPGRIESLRDIYYRKGRPEPVPPESKKSSSRGG